MKSNNVSELSNAQWIVDFAFAVDVAGLMDKLNTKLQGPLCT